MAHVMPFTPVDVTKLCFLRLDAVPAVARAAAGTRRAVRRHGHQPTSTTSAALQDKRAIFESRFAAGDHCVVAVADGRIVGYEWFCEQPVHREAEWDYPIQIPAGCVLRSSDAFIDPGYRNGGLWLRFKAHLGEWMAVAREARGDHVRRTWQRRVVADASTVRLRAERDGAGG